ncbi:MAG TPA: hypothetical protein VHO01_16215 [Jatrophihabitans sp.]|nr:hypothetical protein [Jatrophihabitans sp.]
MTDRFSWALPGTEQPAAPTGVRARLQRRLRDFGWFDLVSVLIGLLVWDFLVGILLSGYFSIRCGANACTLRQDLHRDQLLYLLIPLVMTLPPVLVSLWRRRLRVLVAGFQVAVLVALLAHTAYDANVQRERINGTVPCWNDLYSPKDCPWGNK